MTELARSPSGGPRRPGGGARTVADRVAERAAEDGALPDGTGARRDRDRARAPRGSGARQDGARQDRAKQDSRRDPGRRRAADAGEPGPTAPLSPVHRRRRLVAALAAVLVVLGGLAVGARVLLYDLGLFDVEGVEVSGARTIPQADVLAAAAVGPGGPLAAVDTAGIAARVAQLPGVAAVEVGRGWPHTVVVSVAERIPVALVTTPQGPAPVDAEGVVYPGAVPEGLPRLTFGAVGPDDPSTRAALDVLAALPPDLRGQVLTVDTTVGGGTAQVQLGLTDDRQVRWGPAARSAEKAAVLVALLSRPGTVYDVTSPELPTVRR